MGFAEDWKVWRERPFPSEPSASSDLGFELISIDTYAAGCLETFAQRGSLEAPLIAILERCVRDLQPLLPRVSDSAADYFAELAELCRRVLRAVGHPNER